MLCVAEYGAISYEFNPAPPDPTKESRCKIAAIQARLAKATPVQASETLDVPGSHPRAVLDS